MSTPLHDAVYGNSVTCLQHLLQACGERGGDILDYIFKQDSRGHTVLHIICTLGSGEMLNVLLNFIKDNTKFEEINMYPAKSQRI